MATIRSLRRRIEAQAAKLALLLLLAPGLAQATGCRLQFLEVSPLSLQPNTSTTLSLQAVDSGVGVCTGANFALTVLSDSTSGTAIGPQTGLLIGNSAPTTLSVTAPNLGGGSITWQADCVGGCEAAMPTAPQFTVNILGAVRDLQPALSLPEEVPPGTAVPVAVRVTDNGMGVPDALVNWQLLSGAGGLAQSSSVADSGGVATNTLLMPSSPGASLFRASRDDDPSIAVEFFLESVLYSLSAVQASPSTPPDQSLTLELRLLRQISTAAPVPFEQVAWSLVSGPGSANLQPQDDGFSDGGGISRANFSAALPGVYVVRGSFNPGPLFPQLTQDVTVTVGGAASAELQVLDAPAAVFSEETTDRGVEVLLTGAAQNGLALPLADSEVSFFVRSGNARFASGAGIHTARTDAEGRVRSPSITAGRSAAPILIEVSTAGAAPVQTSIATQAARYRIEALPLAGAAEVGQALTLQARLWRQGSGASVPVANAGVRWITGAAGLAGTLSESDAEGRTSNRFTPPARGSFGIVARFEPGPGLAASEARFQVNVDDGQLGLVSGDGQRAMAGSVLPFPIVVQATRGGAPEAGVVVELGSLPPGLVEVEPARATTDAEGRASFRARLADTAEGTIALRAVRQDNGASIDLRARVGSPPQSRTLVAIDGDAQGAAPGALLPRPLLLEARDDGQPAADVPIQFSVTPAGAAEILPESAATDAEGRLSARVRLSASASGTVQVTARRSDDPDALASFTLFAATGSAETRLQIEAGDAQTGIRGALGADLLVRHTVNGLPAAGVSVQWSTIDGPARTLQQSSLTDTQGRARVGLAFGDALGSSRIRARINADLEVVFRVDTVEGNLIVISGDGQSGAAGAPLPEPLRVQAQPAAPEVPVQWRVLSGGGSLSEVETATDALGQARARWTLGPQAGAQSVGVRLADGEERVFTAQASVPAEARLEIVSGGSQRLPPGVSSAPLEVRVITADGAALPGQRVRWSSDRAELDAEESVSDSEGRASVRARLALPGAARVIAALEGSDARVEFGLNAGLAQIGPLDPRQRDVAEVLDIACAALSALPNPDAAQRDLLARCGDLSDQAGTDPAQVARALSQLPNDVGLSLARAGDEAMRGQIGNLDQRQRALRGGQRMQVAFGLNTPDGSLPLSALPALAALADGEALGDEVGSDFERWGAFINGSFGRGRSRGTGLNPAFDYDLGSLTAGVDYRFSDRFVAGAALGINRDSTEFAAGRGELESRGSVFSAYASVWLPKDAYLDANLSYGRNRFDLSRSLRFSLGSVSVDQRAEADTDATLLGGSLALGRDWQVRSWSLGAYLRGQFSRVDYDAFEERMIGGRAGEGLGLRVESPRWNSLEGVLGGRASRAYSFDWGVLLPNLMFEYSREFRDDPSRLDASFLADPTGSVFRQSGAAIDQSHVNLGLGMSAVFPGGRSGFLQYERRLQDDNLSHWLLSIGGRWEF